MLDSKVCDGLNRVCDEEGGQVIYDAPLSERSTVFIGGKALAWFEPTSLGELVEGKRVLEAAGVPSIVVGNGSNILFPDGVLEAVLISLKKGYFAKKVFKGELVTAGAGVHLGDLVHDSCSRSLAGFEGLVGIPATVGGAVFMNASYREAISDHLVDILVFDSDGQLRRIRKDDMEFGHHYSSLEKDDVIIEASFCLKKKDDEDLVVKMKNNFSEKMEKQPLDKKTLGCVFRNPQDADKRSGELIDEAGMKGVQRGGAQVSEKHANFFVNTGSASSADFIELMEDVKENVREKFSIELQPEIIIL